MNPYTFVPLAGPPQRERATGNDRYLAMSGELHCTLTARTPLFLYDRRAARAVEPPLAPGHEVVDFPTTAEGQPVVWGTAIRGTVRSVAEAASRSCLSLFDGHYERWTVDYRSRLPGTYRRCEFPDPLCPTCRLFGTVGITSSGYAGAVQVSDALPAPEGVTLGERLVVPAIQSPRPHHSAFYLAPDGGIAGRKFYFHRPLGAITTGERSRYTRTIQPVVPDSSFTFTVRFVNLAEADLRLLLFALALQPGLGHKLGMGKPLGLGSVSIAVRAARTRSPRDAALRRAGEELTGEALREWVDALLYPLVEGDSGNLGPLRQVLALDPGRPISYPTAEWFKSHPDAPLSDVPDFLPARRLIERPAPAPAPGPFPAPARRGPEGRRPRPERPEEREEREFGAPWRTPRGPERPRREAPGPGRPREMPAARQDRPPAPQPIEEELAEEEPAVPSRPATLEDLVRRFSRPQEQPRQEQPARTRESERAREEQRRLMERLRRGELDK